MAVTQIRKVSSYTLLISALVSLVVFALFFMGGSEMVFKGTTEYKVYAFTDLLLYWSYFLFLATCLLTILFVALKRLRGGSSDKAEKTSSYIAFGVLSLSLFLGYMLGDATPIEGLNQDAQRFNTEFWLKTTDMWLYSMYILFIAAIIALGFGAVKKFLNR